MINKNIKVKSLIFIYIMLILVVFFGIRWMNNCINQEVNDFKHSRWQQIDNSRINY